MIPGVFVSIVLALGTYRIVPLLSPEWMGHASAAAVR